MKKLLAAASMLSLLSGTAQAAGPRMFKPAGDWQADYGDDYCRLARSFSDGTNTLSVALERFHPTNAVRVILVGNGISMYRGSTELEYTLAPSGGQRKGPFWRSETADGQQYLNLGELFMAAPFAFGAPGAPPPAGPTAGPPPAPPKPGEPFLIPPYDRAAEQEFAKGVTSFSITGGVIDPVTIEIGRLRSVVGALQKCSDDLLNTWGLDAAKHQTMTRPAQPASEASKWLPTGTIGFGDFGKLGGAANQIRVMVGADGKPSACAVHWASLEKKTNDAICKAIMDKGQFHPALDAAGQPMASYWTVAPFFLMPPFGGT